MQRFAQNLSRYKLTIMLPRLLLVAMQLRYPTYEPISGRVDRVSPTEAVDSSLIRGRVKPKTINIGIYSFPASAIKGTA